MINPSFESTQNKRMLLKILRPRVVMCKLRSHKASCQLQASSTNEQQASLLISVIGYGVSEASVCYLGLCLTSSLISPYLMSGMLSESFWTCLELARREQTCPSLSGDGSRWKILEMNGEVYEEHLLLGLLSPSFPLLLIPCIHQNY
jgi:hypothetical protein